MVFIGNGIFSRWFFSRFLILLCSAWKVIVSSLQLPSSVSKMVSGDVVIGIPARPVGTGGRDGHGLPFPYRLPAERGGGKVTMFTSSLP